jgi:hypothetical protein
MTDLCVVHLVRAKNGLAPFERFLRSYRERPGGEPHRLLIVFKGFGSDGAVGDLERLLADVPHDRLHVGDAGLDIGAYVAAARSTSHDLYCFLNSFSVIRDDAWLAKLARHLRGDGRDLVGASGSWISHLTNGLTDPDFGHHFALGDRRFRLPSPLGRLARWRVLRYFARNFDPFPNFHLRTNCFLVSRPLMVGWDPRELRSKTLSYEFESGKRGLSARFRESGRPLLVVGRDGRAYPEQEWAESNTFWQRGQENLLVLDNQADRYAHADAQSRAKLARIAWGDRAAPEESSSR